MERPWWLEAFSSDPGVVRLGEELERGGLVSVRGAAGSSTTMLVAAVHSMLKDAGPILLVVPHIDEADEAVDELDDLGIDAALFPALEVMPGESNPSVDLVAARLSLVRQLQRSEVPKVILAPFPALMQGVPAPSRLDQLQRVIRPGDALVPDELLAWLTESGWVRVDAVENPGECAMRGGLIDLFPPGGGPPIRLDLFGEEVERIFEIDPSTQASDRELDETILLGSTSGILDEDAVPLPSLLPSNTLTVLAELSEIVEQGRGYWERVRDSKGVQGPPAVLKGLRESSQALVDVNAFSASSAAGRVVEIGPAPLPPFDEDVTTAMEELRDMARTRPVAVACTTDGEFERARELLARSEDSSIRIERRHVHRGFILDGEQRPFAVVPFHELLNRWGIRRRAARMRSGSTRDDFLRFEAGDLVVHREHGIAKFLGLGLLPREDGEGDDEVLTLEFHGSSRLHVPVNRIELVQRYVGSGGGRVTLSTLGGKRWKKQKESVEGAVKDLAGELLRVQAARNSVAGLTFPADTDWQREFEAEFPYEETEDQLTAISAIKRDMSQSVPMDRLICGDVGFGKTEVAIRAAFKAAEYGKQVAVLVPTTVLAEQHERTFRSRFRAYPFRVESLSRFKTTAEKSEILKDLAAGRVDVIVGTHRLLSRDVTFKDLGVVVIDEEQRFGVEHKQRLLEFRTTADVLTLSATPIPRTLHMSMLGLRDISSLTTPPLDRRAIVTEVIPYNEQRVKQAISRELARDGQVFFVHNRVYDIESVADEVQKLAPGARILIGHGQMSARELEKVMLAFTRREADILVSTTIIESGVDIPSANTMFINDAHRFGLADLHQLRGRVGRSRHRAYCYMLLPGDRRMTREALRRLKAIEDYSMLGAGFRIAMQDLEIRGAGNLLGPEQSGHIATVGYDMYCRLLEDAVVKLSDEARVEASDTILDIGLDGRIPRGYIPSEQRRMEAYRRIAQAKDFTSLEQVREDLAGAYGDPPSAVERLLEEAEIRFAAAVIGVRSLLVREPDVIFKTREPALLLAAFQGVKGTIRPVGEPDAQGLLSVYFRPPPAFLEPGSLAAVLRKRLVSFARERAESG